MRSVTVAVLMAMAACAADPALDGADDPVPHDPATSHDDGSSVVRAARPVSLDLPVGSATEDTGEAPDDVAADPSCTILAPADGAVAAVGVPVHFEGEVVDEGDDLSTVTWRSDVWGAMVLGTAFDFELPAADHLITMTAVDDGGRSCTASIHLIVR